MATGQGLLGNNMFAYCNNNPVRYCDPSGEVLIEALVVAVGTEWAITIVVGGIVIISGVVYKAIETFVDWLSKQWYRPFVQIQYTVEETLPPQGLVDGDPEAPPVDAGKQGKHVPGHNNYQEGKSSWPEGQTGVQQTQEAWQNGVPDPKKPDGSVRIGIASDGTIVRVHIDSTGSIHGYPYYSYIMFQ